MILVLTIFATFCLVTLHMYLGRLAVHDDPSKDPIAVFFGTSIWFAAPIAMLWVLYARIP